MKTGKLWPPAQLMLIGPSLPQVGCTSIAPIICVLLQILAVAF